ncbi:sigma-70 family RNA polymerase sigma factor [Parvibaculaceae bacterium PLY_AMNH_Bact1]|nr:sigma-70 family RNA polymerase sigma factor [Parvibaculaceae bacterium PLY_AMNH_Bact1]
MVSSAQIKLEASPGVPVKDPLRDLLFGVVRSDSRAFSELYELTSPRLYALCLRTTGRADLAEEALQEGYIRIWKSASQFDPARGSALAWITTVVRNRARTLAVKTYRQAAIVDDGYDMADAPDAHAVSGFDKVLSAERVRRVRACLSGVDGDKKRALLLVYFEGLTHQELAGRLDVPLGTAKSWVRRGLHQMGRCLGGGDGMRGEAVHDLLAAEHELGVLPPTATPAFQRRRDADAKYCAAADRWADDFAALLTLLAPVRPRDAVWEGISRETRASPRARFERWHGLLVALIISVLIVFQFL